jgi:hypothetical protein
MEAPEVKDTTEPQLNLPIIYVPTTFKDKVGLLWTNGRLVGSGWQNE